MRILTPAPGDKVEIVRVGRDEARLAIAADGRSPEHRQWFSFVAEEVGGRRCTFELGNAGECTYADAWEGYRVCASYDGEDWFRVPTELDGGTLRFFHEPAQASVRYAYFAPYPPERRARLIEAARASGRARVDAVGTTILGETMRLLTLGSDDDGARQLWVVGHQHPGETMGSWFMEGLLLRALDPEDDTVGELLRHARLHLVLCMNPDGAALGNHRTNAAGVDLNRAWWEASPEESPEILGVRQALYERGVDFFLDVHGDEHVPHVFVAGAEGNPHYTDRIEALEEAFADAMLDASEDFQTEEGYPKDAPGKGDLRCAGNYAGEAFDCLSLTLEMPFKDNANAPDEERGWGVDRCRALGAASLDAAATVLDVLR